MTQDARHYADDTAAPAPLPADSDGARPEKAPGLLRRFWSFFSSTIIACGAIFLINQVFLFYAVVPTGSMKNLIMEGSYILANRLAYAQSEVQHGDVIVFSHEGSDMRMKYLVKRVIGIAGDTIELRDGDVYRNGEKLDESAYVLGRTFPRNSQTTFTVPDGCVLVFGDNREGSADARGWADPYVPVKTIKGKVFCTFSIRHWYIRKVA